MPINMMKWPVKYYEVASFQDIKRTLRENTGTPIVMTLTEDIGIAGVIIKAWSKIMNLYPNGEDGDQVMWAAYPDPNQGAWIIGIANGIWHVKVLSAATASGGGSHTG